MPQPDLRRTIEELARDVAGLDYLAAQEQLRALYRLAWLTILDDAERLMREGGRPPAQLARLLASVGRVLRQVDRSAAQWASLYLPRAFSAGLRQGVLQFAQQGVRLDVPAPLSGVHEGAIREVARDTMHDLLRATQRVEEGVKDRIRQVAREEVLTQAVTGRRASGRIIAERLAEEQVYGVQDKRGRFIPMEQYARIVSNVKLREAHTRGMEGLMQDHGFDLVQISQHVHEPDLCTPLEGKVYSLTGQTPGWPKLPRHTPFHPGCRHVETPFVDTFLSDEKIAALKERSGSARPVTVYTSQQLAAASVNRQARERARARRRQSEKRNAVAVARGRRQPQKALREEVLAPPRVGGRYLNQPHPRRVSERPPEEIEAAWALHQNNARLLELLPGLDSSDLRTVASYVAGVNDHVWDAIAEGGAHGASLLLHELVELQHIYDQGLNPFEPREQHEGRRLAHPQALLVEHDYLLEIAHSMVDSETNERYNFRSILPLVLQNPIVSWGHQRADGVRVQGLRPGMTVTQEELDAADRFYRQLREGR